MGIYGSDTSTRQGPGGGLDTTGALLDDANVIGEDMLRAVTTEEGALPWAPEATFNVENLLGKSMTAGERAAAGRKIEGCFRDDDRYNSVTASVEYDGEGELHIGVRAETDTGTFTLELEQDGDAMRVVKEAA